MRSLPCLAILCALLPQPVWAQDDPGEYERAVAARQAGQPAEAVRLLETWLAANPADVDARLQYGYALLALGRLDDADEAFRAVLASAPDYADARDGLSLVQARRAASGRQAYLLIDGAISDLSGDARNWREFGIAGTVPVGTAGTGEIRGTAYERFGRSDTEFSAGYTHRSAEDLWLRFGVSATPSADFRPRVGASLGLDYRVAPQTVMGADMGWQAFPVQDVWTLRAGATQYFGNGRFSVSAFGRVVKPEGEEALLGGTARLDYLPQDRTRLFLGAATGPETDLGVVRDTTSVFAGGEFPVTSRVSLLGSVAYEDREAGADRTEGRLGVKFGF